MGFFDPATAMDSPEAIEIIANMTAEERKKLKNFTLKNIFIIIIFFLILTTLFILTTRDMPISILVKWFMAVGFMSSGYVISKIFIFLMTRKQKSLLNSTKYAQLHSIVLD